MESLFVTILFANEINKDPINFVTAESCQSIC